MRLTSVTACDIHMRSRPIARLPPRCDLLSAWLRPPPTGRRRRGDCWPKQLLHRTQRAPPRQRRCMETQLNSQVNA